MSEQYEDTGATGLESEETVDEADLGDGGKSSRTINVNED